MGKDMVPPCGQCVRIVQHFEDGEVFFKVNQVIAIDIDNGHDLFHHGLAEHVPGLKSARGDTRSIYLTTHVA